MATYLTDHHSNGWMYQRYIPKHLRPLFGGKSIIRRYIPKTTGKQMALALARAWAVEHDAKIGVYKRIPQLERTLMVAGGGLAALNKSGEDVLADVVSSQ